MKLGHGGNCMKRNEKLVIHGNEFYVIDLDCLERKEKRLLENMGKDTAEENRKRKGSKKKDSN